MERILVAVGSQRRDEGAEQAGLSSLGYLTIIASKIGKGKNFSPICTRIRQ
jgi:hypothetical protein